jgi:ribonuclease-3
LQDNDRLDVCEAQIGYHFRNRDLLSLALTHASDKAGKFDHEPDNEDLAENGEEPLSPVMLDNERLEFLGDSVLGMVVCEELFHTYPESTEGEMTNIKSVLVSRSVLSKISDDLGLAEFMALGKGMSSYELLPESLRANVFEAVVAAIYLDGGIDAARGFILEHMREHIQLVESNKHRRNYKSTLQQYAQREFGITPTYRVIAEEGPDHIKEFEVVAIIGDTEYAHGRGKSKKDAEQQAAGRTLRALREKTKSSSPLFDDEDEEEE